MKKYILISVLSLLFVTFNSYGQGIKFQDIKFEEALKIIQNSKGEKQIFIDFYTTWCGPCKMMSEKIFPLKEVGDYMNKHFVSLKLDAERGEGKELARRYNVESYPTMLVVGNNGEEVRRVIGYKADYKEFLGRVAGGISDETLMETAKAEYNKNPTEENATAYLNALLKLRRVDEITATIEKIYFSMPLEKRFTTQMWSYIDDFINDPESQIIKDIVANRVLISSNSEIGQKSVDKKLKQVYSIRLLEALSDMTQITKEQAYYYSDMVNMLESPRLNSYPRPATIVVGELTKLKLDNDMDAMLKILDSEVCLLPNNFYRIQTEIAFSKYPNLNLEQRTKLKAYYEKVSKMEVDLGKELEKMLSEFEKK